MTSDNQLNGNTTYSIEVDHELVLGNQFCVTDILCETALKNWINRFQHSYNINNDTEYLLLI